MGHGEDMELGMVRIWGGEAGHVRYGEGFTLRGWA